MLKSIHGSLLLAAVQLAGQQVPCPLVTVDSYAGTMPGAPMVTAYSNGAFTGGMAAVPLCGSNPALLPGQTKPGQDGLEFECVEFVRRFYREAKNVPTSAWRADGKDFYLRPPYFGLVGYPNGGNIAPQLDDIVGFASDPHNGP